MQYKHGYTWTGADSSEISERKSQHRTNILKKRLGAQCILET